MGSFLRAPDEEGLCLNIETLAVCEAYRIVRVEVVEKVAADIFEP